MPAPARRRLARVRREAPWALPWSLYFLRQPSSFRINDSVAVVCLALGRRRLAAGDDLARPLAGARIGMSPLTAHRQSLAMTQSAIASEVHQALDVLLHLAAQVAFDLVVGVEHVTNPHLLLGREVIGLGRRIDLGRVENPDRGGAADAVDVGQRDFHALVLGQ